MMNLRTPILLVSLATTTALAGCMTPSSEKSTHGDMIKGGHSHMDMAKMCADHRQMMASRTPEEKQKMMESHVQSMHGSADPKMVAMHRQMMDKHCAQMGSGAK
jgi:hypothetical protein